MISELTDQIAEGAADAIKLLAVHGNKAPDHLTGVHVVALCIMNGLDWRYDWLNSTITIDKPVAIYVMNGKYCVAVKG